MKTQSIITLFFLLIHELTTFATERYVTISYELEKSSEIPLLKLTLILKDTLDYSYSDDSDNDTSIRLDKLSEFFPMGLSTGRLPDSIISPTSVVPSHPPARVKFTHSFIKHIQNEIKKNSSLEIYVKRPDYFNKILDLIQNQKDNEKAIAIFNENNSSIRTNMITKRDFLMQDGKRVVNHIIEIKIPLIIHSPTELVIGSILLEYKNNEYKTQQLVIKIE